MVHGNGYKSETDPPPSGGGFLPFLRYRLSIIFNTHHEHTSNGTQRVIVGVRGWAADFNSNATGGVTPHAFNTYDKTVGIVIDMSNQPIPTASAEVPSSQVSQLDLSVSIAQQDALQELIRCDAMMLEDILQMLDDAFSWIACSGPQGKRYLNDVFQRHLREVLESSDLDEELQAVFIGIIESFSPSPF